MDRIKTLDEFKEEISVLIEQRTARFQEQFGKREFHEIPKIFPLYSQIVTHEGEVILGKDCANYWRKVYAMDPVGLNFEVVYFDGIELYVSPEATGDEIDLVVIEITKFTFQSGGNTYTGYIDPTYRHILKCIPAP